MQVRLALVATLVMVLALAGQATAARTPTASAAGRCVKVSSGLVASLRGSLKPKLRSKLGTPWGVKSRGHFGGLRGIREGPVYFVSANVRGYGVATWAVDADAFKNGGGVVIGVGTVARRVSDAGVDIPTSTLRAWGLAPSAEGYAASRSCIK